MDPEKARELFRVLANEGLKIELRDNYTGRGMGGRTCPAIVTDDPAAVAWAAGKLGWSWDDVPSSTDSMGTQTVLY